MLNARRPARSKQRLSRTYQPISAISSSQETSISGQEAQLTHQHRISTLTPSQRWVVSKEAMLPHSMRISTTTSTAARQDSRRSITLRLLTLDQNVTRRLILL